MMIYSVIPPDLILSDADGAPSAIDTVPLATGALVCVRRLPGQCAVIERVVSTDPRHYLDPNLAPGHPWVQAPPPRA